MTQLIQVITLWGIIFSFNLKEFSYSYIWSGSLCKKTSKLYGPILWNRVQLSLGYSATKERLSFAQDLSLENSLDSHLCFRLVLLHSASYFRHSLLKQFFVWVLSYPNRENLGSLQDSRSAPKFIATQIPEWVQQEFQESHQRSDWYRNHLLLRVYPHEKINWCSMDI